MVEIMPFGRMIGKSVEQVCLNDYKYFIWLQDEADIWKKSVRDRVDFVEYKANNFKSSLPCQGPGCEEIPRYISISFNPHNNVRTSSSAFIYCSEECYRNDPKALSERARLMPLKFRNAVSPTKFDTNRLVQTMAKCMGIKEGRHTKKYLEDFFNNIECW